MPKTHLIDFISDVHIDFWLKEINPSMKLEHLIDIFIRKVLKPKGNHILVLAGDLGHYFAQDSELLKQLNAIYEHLVIVTGNHDLYLVSKNQQSKYRMHSYDRVNEMKEFCKKEGIHYLDGDVVEIDGLKIGGTGMWYDLEGDARLAQWNEQMNDSNLIMEGAEPIRFQYGYGAYHKASQWDTQAHYHREVDNLKSMVDKDVDVLVTHILPVILPEEKMVSWYRGDKNNIFYMSDNMETVKAINPDVIIFGHTHESYDLDIESLWFICNPLGYKGEKTGNSIQQIEIVK